MTSKRKPNSKQSIKSSSTASSSHPPPSLSPTKSTAASTAPSSPPISRSVKAPTSPISPRSVKAPPKNTPITVYELGLQDDGSPSKEKSYIRLPSPVEPYLLRFSIAAGARASNSGTLYTNFPLEGHAFERKKFHAHSLPQDTSQPVQIDLKVTQAGAFEFYVEFQGDSTKEEDRVKSKPGYFNVDPVLTAPGRHKILSGGTENQKILPVGEGGSVKKGSSVNIPLDGLVIQTVIAKWMGKMSQWPKYMDVIRDRGYNMIHFTPLQARGESGSPYSIYDQLRFDPELFDKAPKSAEDEQKQLSEWLSRLRDEWGILSLTDVVWNHTANNSPWLRDHPESGYNIVNSPHLEPALELDTALLGLSDKLAEKNLPQSLDSEVDLDRIMHFIEHETLAQLKLWEFYVINVDHVAAKFSEAWSNVTRSSQGHSVVSTHIDWSEFEKACINNEGNGWKQITGPRGHISQKIVIDSAVKLFKDKGYGSVPPEETMETLKRILNELNVDRYQEYDDDLKAIIQNTRTRIRYTRLDPHGPKMGPITKKCPMIESLFTRLEKDSQTKNHDPRSLALANNGWIWNANPLEDFASAKSKAYLRREVIVWGDCVKLRYGQNPKENPFLWDHMTKYTELLARFFGGFRIDNCHSTPIHVGEHLLDVARRVRPDLYVCAELFTGSEDMDTYFVSRLGINSLIREAMNGHDPKDQSRLLYNYGLGKPIGSMDTDCLTEISEVSLTSKNGEKSKVKCEIVPLHGSKPHAFLMDCTHDNESPADKRTARDAISTGGLVAFAFSAIGSNKGFDDLYPKLLDLVGEKRLYDHVEVEAGIGRWKRLLNHLHSEMAADGFKEGHFHQEHDYIMSHRVHPSTHEGYLLVAHTAFHGDSNDRGFVAPMKLRRTKAAFILGSSLEILSKKNPSNETTLKGLESKLTPIESGSADNLIKPGSDSDGDFIEIITPKHFPPGSLMLFKTWMEGMKPDQSEMKGRNLESLVGSGATEKFDKLDMVELNLVLFRTDGEERDASEGHDGAYDVPGLGKNVYCGLEGWMHHLRYIIRTNDLGHPLCAHLRDGPWAFEYVLERLRRNSKQLPKLRGPVEWLEERIQLIKSKIPAFMRPKYFALLIYAAYKASKERAIALCSPFIRQGTVFIHSLALTAVQMYGLVPSASLDPKESLPCVAAGLPHFSSGWARTWGRDCAISASGLFIKTGLFEIARAHLLCFCTTLKHGLMPNLLDSVRTPRYNSRDSPWFMLQLLQEYVKHSKEGDAILSVEVKRRFPSSDEWVPWDSPTAYSEKLTVGEVVGEILERHAQGIDFREYNAGPAIDGQMSDKGFNINIHVDWSTGLILGGNEKNCGTWMDKMGESEKAGNKGFPGTPRDGAPVEIIGLLYSTLVWAAGLAKAGKLQKNSVDTQIDGKKVKVTYDEWAQKIQKNFEKCYWVPLDPKEDKDFIIEPKLITRRGVYKDVYGTPSDRAHADYQLRPNFPIAMAVAPKLFTPARALIALKTAREALIGPLGMRTLDPQEADYRPDYDNANDSSDWHVAKGRNYHQGPEWVWPIGYYLRAFLHFDTLAGEGLNNHRATIHQIHSILAEHRRYIQSDPWAGLPELTNRNGAFCRDSCESQAWSTSTILDVLFEIYHLDK
ncbi:hypothetical protein MJO29_011332 [Puccinia striiformis f. sp. tritici]|uniref:Glycogen debranching enzyme n=1 Tax=Puccinia striiformis f. sp. tritici PST-78 TaxID=1165861 RepID=A0A0L0VQ97_9BASI|nr:hypothetical protein MJO29_011332 [Puccinia striiformis f. sp. tritici]KNF01175.1 hypothetical protein PSTG_05529 [Puccinia striiformis f. sp. tritici PST-78]